MLDDSPAAHVYHSKQAAPALKAAMAALAADSSREVDSFEGTPLGDAYELAVDTYGDDLPEYWRVWQSWNASHTEPPASMGEL